MTGGSARVGRRSLLAGVLAVTVAGIVISVVVLGMPHTLGIAGVLVAVAIVSGAGTEAIVRARRHDRAGPLRRQLAIVIALVITPLLAALLVLGLIMFVSGRDAALVGVIVGVAGAIGVVCAVRLADGVSGDVAAIRDAVVAVGEGERRLEVRAESATELSELARAVDVMVGRLAAEEAARDHSDTARRRLVAAASHDLRTPITSLGLLAQAIDDGIVDDDVRRDYIRRMLTHIGALSTLIDDLFELSRLEAGEITWSLEQVALNELVSGAVDAMRPAADAKGVRVCAELPAGLAPAHANAEKLQRVLFNLIQNAIRHSPSDGSVVVRAESIRDVIEVEVADHGSGISAADRGAVFDAFFQGGDGSRSGDGAGLGLAIARAIVEAHGGEIWLAEASRGTRVRFSVPIAVAA